MLETFAWTAIITVVILGVIIVFANLVRVGSAMVLHWRLRALIRDIRAECAKADQALIRGWREKLGEYVEAEELRRIDALGQEQGVDSRVMNLLVRAQDALKHHLAAEKNGQWPSDDAFDYAWRLDPRMRRLEVIYELRWALSGWNMVASNVYTAADLNVLAHDVERTKRKLAQALKQTGA